MTISEIAKLAGVSSAAVSRYLNDGSLSQEKRQRIERVIRETKYRPSEYARTMRTKKSNRIGVLVPQIDSESVPKILSGISERMDQKNYHVLLMNSNLSLEKEIGILETFEQSQVDGLIFVASVLTKRHEKALEHMGVPVVILGQKSEKYPCIYHEQHLLSTGHWSFYPSPNAPCRPASKYAIYLGCHYRWVNQHRPSSRTYGRRCPHSPDN